MASVTRRRFLKLSASGAVAAQTGGLAAILATGRAPAFAQGTTVHWLRGSDFVPASDVLLKGQITQECQPEGDRYHAQGRNHQRQRPAGAHYLSNSIGNRTRHHHGSRQLAAALR